MRLLRRILARDTHCEHHIWQAISVITQLHINSILNVDLHEEKSTGIIYCRATRSVTSRVALIEALIVGVN